MSGRPNAIPPDTKRRIVAALRSSEESKRAIAQRFHIDRRVIEEIAEAHGIDRSRNGASKARDPHLSPAVTRTLLQIERANKPLERIGHVWIVEGEIWRVNVPTHKALTAAGYLAGDQSRCAITDTGREAAKRMRDAQSATKGVA